MPIPYVGQIVHYQSYGTPGGEFLSVPRAAIVADVHDYGAEVTVCVLNPSGLFFNTVEFAREPKPGCANPITPPRLVPSAG